MNRLEQELNTVLKNYKNNPQGEWQQRMKTSLEVIKNYNPINRGYSEYEVAYSNGKDSHALLFAHLVAKKLHGIDFKVHHNVTTIDPSSSVIWGRDVFRQLTDMGVSAKAIRPKKTFHQLIRYNNMAPTRTLRFCCADLKENYRQTSVVSVGVRADESNSRRDRGYASIKTYKGYVEYTELKDESFKDFFNSVSQINKRLRTRLFTNCTVSPIIHWTLGDIKSFFEENQIEISPTYTIDGKVDYSRRLGCIGCPLAGAKSQAQDYKENPNHLLAFLITVDTLDRESLGNHVAKLGIQQLAWNLHSHKTETLEEIMKKHGIWELIKEKAQDKTIGERTKGFWQVQYKQMIESADYKLLSGLPFTCSKCKRKSTKGKLDGVYAEHCRSLNKKMINREIKPRNMLCPTCLAEFYNTSTENIVDKVNDFLNEGCELF